MGLSWGRNRVRATPDWRRLLPFAAGTLLLLLGLFAAWQTWLIADEGHANDRVHRAQDDTVRAITAELDRERRAVRAALDGLDPAAVLTDPVTAARWANGLVGLANELLRTRALEEAQRNIAYLNAQADRTNEVELRRAIFNLIESETKTLMLANGRTEYAFRVVDPAVPPEIRSGPHRTLLLVTGLLVGLLLGGVAVLIADWVRRQAVRLRRDA